jgi:hypothetical protein
MILVNFLSLKKPELKGWSPSHTRARKNLARPTSTFYAENAWSSRGKNWRHLKFKFVIKWISCVWISCVCLNGPWLSGGRKRRRSFPTEGTFLSTIIGTRLAFVNIDSSSQRRVLPTYQFSAKKWHFLKNQCSIINILNNIALFWAQNANFFAIFWRKYFKNQNIDPGFSWAFCPLCDFGTFDPKADRQLCFSEFAMQHKMRENM